MTGIEILAIEDTVVGSVFNWTVFWIAFGVLILVAITIGIYKAIKHSDRSILSICIATALLFGGVSGVVLGNMFSIPTEYETRYKIIISEEVKMIEFFENYEIVNQEGKIYTVKEIE